MRICAKDAVPTFETSRHSEILSLYGALPTDVQQLAQKNFELLKKDPSHPSLHFKKGGRFWSVRVGIHFRAVAVEESSTIVWFWIGPHQDYERLIRNRS